MDGISLKQEFIVFQLINACQIVRSHDEGKLMLRIFFVQVNHRIDGVRRLWERKLNIGSFESGIIVDGQLDHMQAVKIIGESCPVF